ncbi:beta-microseminoprotein [Alosa pseudoharengus]|uniref:beta-microseminoprotein n=1 Tax=Alosa pseudoharengus TaxID=34774 RepID=UPI003F8918F4
MGSFLRLGTFLCLVAVISGQCFFEPLVIENINELPTGCQDRKGDIHPFGSNWVTENCYSCDCTEGGAGCCNTIPNIVMMPEDCQQIVDKKTCTSKVVLKSDPSVECPGGIAAVLK